MDFRTLVLGVAGTLADPHEHGTFRVHIAEMISFAHYQFTLHLPLRLTTCRVDKLHIEGCHLQLRATLHDHVVMGSHHCQFGAHFDDMIESKTRIRLEQPGRIPATQGVF